MNTIFSRGFEIETSLAVDMGRKFPTEPQPRNGKCPRLIAATLAGRRQSRQAATDASGSGFSKAENPLYRSHFAFPKRIPLDTAKTGRDFTE